MEKSVFDVSINEMPTILPVLPFADTFLFPQTKLQLRLYETRYVNLVLNSLAHGRIAGVVAPDADGNSYRTGCAGRVTSFAEATGGCLFVTLTGVARFDIVRDIQDYKGYRRVEANFERFKEDFDPPEFKRDLSDLYNVLDLYAYSNKIDAPSSLFKNMEPVEMFSSIVQTLPFGAAEKQAFMESVSVAERFKTLMMLLNAGDTFETGTKKAGNC